MFGDKRIPERPSSENGGAPSPTALLTIVGERARVEGKFEIADSIQIECEVGGELNVGGKLVIGEKGVVNANVQTVDAVIRGHYQGTMVATGDVEITETGRVSGNVQTDSLVISKGGFFNGNVTKMHEDPAAGAPRQVVVPIDEMRAAQQGITR
jgi:cytoskeletal protein CcmA (bactofilin family)